MTKRSQSILLLFIAAVLWSTSGYLLILVDWNPLAITGTRSAFALVPMLIMFGKPRPIWKKAPEETKRSIAPIMAALLYAATLFTFVTANRLTTAANVIMLQYTAPVYVAFMSAFLLKEKIRKQDVLTVAIVMAGMLLFFVGDMDPRGIWGNLLALISGVTLAGMAVSLRMMKNNTRLRPADSIMWGNILCVVLGVPFVAYAGMPGPVSWVGIALLGLFQLGLAYCLYVKAVKHVTALELTLVPIVEPLLNPILVAIFAFQVPGVFTIVGGAIVIVAVTWNLVDKHRKGIAP